MGGGEFADSRPPHSPSPIGEGTLDSRYGVFVHVAIYAANDAGGKRFLSTLQRRIERQEIRAWEVRRKKPLTLVHSGERYAAIRVTFMPAGSRGFGRVTREGALGAFRDPEPTLVAGISSGPSSDRVLGFLVGLLTRHAEPLGVDGVGIPLRRA
jgi:hypothetical protein